MMFIFFLCIILFVLDRFVVLILCYLISYMGYICDLQDGIVTSTQ